jgi:hypothetical protein
MTEELRKSLHVTFMGWEDTPHLDADAKATLTSGYLPHEIGARTRGEPSLGAGAIYPIAYTQIICDPFEIPAYWKRGYGMDVGWNRTAASFFALDGDADVLYLYAEYYRAQAEPSIHAAAILAHGRWMTGSIDPASRGRSQVDGEQLFSTYTQLGLNITPANNSREAGILEVWQRLSTGRLKVFSNCQNWIKEYRFYRRDDKGQIVKKADHLMDSTRYHVVSGVPNMQLDPQYLTRLGHKVGGVISEYDPISESAFAA